MIMEDKPNVLYHYTSMSTLFKLLDNLHTLPEDAKENRIDNYSLEFRASHLSFVNDPTEREFFLSGLTEAMVQYEKKMNLPEGKSENFLCGVRIFQELLGEDYTISLSENEDSLTMWRSYGANGCGVAIGFDREKLEKLDSGKLARVKYMNNREIVSIFSNELLRNIYNESIKDTKRGVNQRLDILKQVKSDAGFIKNEAYTDEKEWKFSIYAPDNMDVDFYEKNGLIIPYYKIKIPFSAIDRIIIGPCANSELSVKSLRMMIEKKLIGIPDIDLIYWCCRIIKSKVPYINL